MSSPETKIQMKRSFSVSRDKVFAAWTQPDQIKKWFAPSYDYGVPEAQVELEVGGRYRISMKSPEGELYTVIGQYLEVSPPEKLVYTWAWEGSEMEKQETRVTVEFMETETGTDLLLTHELFPNAEVREKHSQGWTGCLGRLEKLLS